ncbi:hypothetical protein [Demequina sp.]|uniref:hypothetical protein n=1 Tax=Demequina sp. TaxID=2050685 RepID=UPI003D11C0BD
MTVKISISLPDADVETLDALVTGGLATGRSDAVQLAIARVRESVVEARLAQQFAAALEEDYDPAWDVTVGDGL